MPSQLYICRLLFSPKTLLFIVNRSTKLLAEHKLWAMSFFLSFGATGQQVLLIVTVAMWLLPVLNLGVGWLTALFFVRLTCIRLICEMNYRPVIKNILSRSFRQKGLITTITEGRLQLPTLLFSPATGWWRWGAQPVNTNKHKTFLFVPRTLKYQPQERLRILFSSLSPHQGEVKVISWRITLHVKAFQKDAMLIYYFTFSCAFHPSLPPLLSFVCFCGWTIPLTVYVLSPSPPQLTQPSLFSPSAVQSLMFRFPAERQRNEQG